MGKNGYNVLEELLLVKEQIRLELILMGMNMHAKEMDLNLLLNAVVVRIVNLKTINLEKESLLVILLILVQSVQIAEMV
jgi:hypothetical protein